MEIALSYCFRAKYDSPISRVNFSFRVAGELVQILSEILDCRVIPSFPVVIDSAVIKLPVIRSCNVHLYKAEI